MQYSAVKCTLTLLSVMYALSFNNLLIVVIKDSTPDNLIMWSTTVANSNMYEKFF